MANSSEVRGSNAMADTRNRVITIEATTRPEEIAVRVAAYCRVSTDSLDQMNSFAAQMKYYMELITGKSNWKLVDIYADPGVTGTSAKKRKDFQRLLTDCRRGKIDRVLVKSISRFARNTKKCLEIVRELKAIGVAVVFEEQHIDTGAVSGEFLTSVFAAIAQKESESTSARCSWGYQFRMQNGLFNTYHAPYGFRLKDGELEICEEEAAVVREIFSSYLSGAQPREIVRELKTEGRCRYTWNRKTVEYILKNERYAGNALLQKRYTTDTLPRRQPRNHGERAMYYVESINGAIVTPEEFNQAKRLRQERSRVFTPNPRILSGVMTCGCCGRTLRPKTANGKEYMVCRTHEEDRVKCPIPQIPEGEIIECVLRMYHKLKHHSEILEGILDRLLKVRERKLLWRIEVVEMNKRISDLSCQNQMLSQLKKAGLIDPDIFVAKINALTEQLRDAKREKERILAADDDRTIPLTRMMIEALEDGPDFLETYDEEILGELIERIIVEDRKSLRFRLKNGLEIVEHLKG